MDEDRKKKYSTPYFFIKENGEFISSYYDDFYNREIETYKYQGYYYKYAEDTSDLSEGKSFCIFPQKIEKEVGMASKLSGDLIELILMMIMFWVPILALIYVTSWLFSLFN